MPLRYVINLILIVAVWFVLNSLIQSGVITNYWSGILITVGINIILATSLNVATGYLGQLPLGHAGFMAVGAYAGGIFMKAMPVQELLKAGNTGLNLVGASVVVHADPWWNAAAQNQATDRAHRIGQTQDVNVYQIVAKDTIEERILKLQEKKSELAQQFTDGTASGGVGTLSKDDLLGLLS